MQIHRILGRDLKDALERAGLEYGSDALVLGHEAAPGGGVTVAVGRPSALTQVFQRPPLAPAPIATRAAVEVERVLLRHGASQAFCAEVVRRVEQRDARGAFAFDAAAQALAELLPIAVSPRMARAQPPAASAVPRQCLIAWVGPRASGKTTTLLKLAQRLVRSHRRVGIASLAVRHPGALETLQGQANLLQVPVEAAPNGELLVRALGRLSSADVVLIDGSGEPSWDARELRKTAQWVAAGGTARALELYWTQPAGRSEPHARPWLPAFEDLPPSGLALTKLDETRQPIPALELAAAPGAPGLVFLCDAPEISRGLRRATPDLVADLCLRGKLS